MSIFIITLLNGIAFALYCYLVGRIVLQKKESSFKKIILAFIPFIIAYYIVLCLLESIYATFFSGLLAYFFISIIFEENTVMSLFISVMIHTFKNVNKILILTILDRDELLLVNTYKSLDYNSLYINAGALALATILIFLFRKPIRKFIKHVSSLTNRKYILLIAIYINFILIFIFQHPDDIFCIPVITDFLMIIALTNIGIFSLSSEMKTESLGKHYQEMFKYAKANGELLAHYKMQVHENKNRLLLIKGMEPKKEIKNYIDSILKEVEENKTLANYWISELRYISIPGIRNFINYKLGRLTELGAEIEVFVSSELEKIDSNSLSDKEYNQLSTILGVVLDNMIDAISVCDKKLISINIYIEDDEVHAEFVNTFKGDIDLCRLNEIGYTTKGEQHGAGLPLVAKITKLNKRFTCLPNIIDDFFVQHLIIKIQDKNNLQKITKK